MKKLLSALLALTLLCAMAGCGSAEVTPETQRSTQAPTTTEPTPVTNPETTTEGDPAEEPSTDGAETGGTLIAYFSWSGNTAQLAQLIQAETGGDLYEIAPETPYTDNYNDLLDQAQEEQRNNARPALSGLVENWDSYDVIFVGYPNWWSDVPMLILSFLEAHDCTGKTIVPFATSGGGGFGRGIDSITASATGATILEGFHVGGSRVDGAADDVAAWIAGLGV